MKGISTMCIILLSLVPAASAQYYGTELPFVIGNSARSATIGVAGASLLPDASIQYRNPSALSFLEWKEVLFLRTVLFDSKSSYHALSYAHPSPDYGSFGLSLMRLDVGGVEERSSSNQLLSDDMRVSQMRLLLGYARPITSSITAGFNLKIDHQAIGSFSSSGVGADMGLTVSHKVDLGGYIHELREALVIENLIEPSVKLDVEKVSDPMRFSIGVAALGSIGGAHLVTELDVVNPRYSPTSLRLLQEVSYRGLYALRFGIDRESPSFGFGAKYSGVGIDYSYTSVDLGGNHRFSLSYRFGRSVTEIRESRRAALEKTVDEKISERLSEMESRQIQIALNKADSLYREGDYESALSHYEGVLLIDPENKSAQDRAKLCKYEALIEQGREAFDEEDFGPSLFYFRQSLEIVPGDSTALAMAALCEKRIADSRNVEEQIERLFREAIDLYAKRDYVRALSGFEEVINLDSDNALATEYRDKCLGNIEAEVTKLLERATTLERAGNVEGALDAVKRALAYKKKDSALEERKASLVAKLALRGKTRSHTQSPAKVEKPQERRGGVDPGILEKSYNRGMRAFNKGNFESAIENFLEVWTADPGFHNVTSFLTRAYLYMGMRKYSEEKYTEAMEVWKKVLAIDPRNEKAKRYLAKTSMEYEKLSGSDHGK